MTIQFKSPEGLPLRSTEFARAALGDSARSIPKLRDEILGAPDWRNWYLRLYAELAIEEGKSKGATELIARTGLEAFQERLFTENGMLAEQIAKSWQSEEELVTTASIKGSFSPKAFAVVGESGTLEKIASDWVAKSLAEPGLIDAYRFIDKNPNLPISEDLLFAVAGAAEFAPTENWLSWGGLVAVVARSGKEKWLNLIQMARNSAGEMLIPIATSKLVSPVEKLSDEEIAELAGLDITEDAELISNWLSKLAGKNKRAVLGLYAYSPGVDHIRVQAVQDALALTALQNLEPNQLALSWLATPTDSAPGRALIAKAQEANFHSRSALVVIRDSLLGLFGAARKVSPKYFHSDSGEELALIDSSVQQQGPSYSFSKRTQRWRAYLAHFAGYKVSYAIAPPAKTNSVLRHKILRASYRGALLFGIKPFEVATAKSAIALVLLRDLHDKSAMQNREDHLSLHTQTAIHGGLWRLGYRPKSVWIAATVLGILDYFKRR